MATGTGPDSGCHRNPNLAQMEKMQRAELCILLPPASQIIAIKCVNDLFISPQYYLHFGVSVVLIVKKKHLWEIAAQKNINSSNNLLNRAEKQTIQLFCSLLIISQILSYLGPAARKLLCARHSWLAIHKREGWHANLCGKGCRRDIFSINLNGTPS